MNDGTCAQIGVAAKGIVRRHDGAVLLIKRSITSVVDPGSWDFPGGKMEYGERLVTALAREALEETGLLVTVGRPLFVINFEKPPFWVTCVTFECDAEGDGVTCRDFRWVMPGHVPDRSYARAVREQLTAYASLHSQPSTRS